MKAVVTALVVGLTLSGATICAAQVATPLREVTPPEAVVSTSEPVAQPISTDDLFATPSSNSATWSADGQSIIFNSDQSGRLNIWRQQVSGGSPVQLTHSDQRQSSLAASPDGKSVLFHSDRDGHQINDIYRLPIEGGEPINLTGTGDISEASPLISADGSLMAFSSRKKTAQSANVAVTELATQTTRLLTDEGETGLQWEVIAISRDNRFLIATRHDYSLTVGEVYRVEIATGVATLLSPAGLYSNASALSPNGRYVALTISTPDGRLQPALFDLSSGRRTSLPTSEWDQRAGPFSPDGRSLVLVSNVDGREALFLYDIGSGRSNALNVPPGVNSQRGFRFNLPKYSPDGRKLLFSHTSGSEPLEYWIYDLEEREAQPITRFSDFGKQPLPRSQIVHYRSSDGTLISAMLWIPYNLKRNGEHAAAIMAHGGPTGQVMDQFDRTAIALASRGYFVLAPNFRGSTGYGRAFLEANRKDLGGGDLEDVVAGAKFLTRTGYVSSERLGIFGGSYGGYLTLMALAKTPDMWAAGVDQFGIVNWRTMWENGDPTNQLYQKGLIGDPSTNPGVYDRTSPLTYLHQLRAPLLVLQGENDPLVPASEARQVVDALQQDGRTVDSHFYPDEGHGFAKRENQVHALERIIGWFDRYL